MKGGSGGAEQKISKSSWRRQRKVLKWNVQRSGIGKTARKNMGGFSQIERSVEELQALSCNTEGFYRRNTK